MLVNSTTIRLLAPEIILMIGAIWLFIAGTSSLRSRAWWTFFASVLYLAAGLALFRQSALEVHAGLSLWGLFELKQAYPTNGPITVDFLAHLVRWLALMVGWLLTLIASRGAAEKSFCEYLGLLMFIVVGVMLVGSAGELALLFLGLELISIPTYVLLFLGRSDRATAEATVKYFFLSVLSSAIFLYGLSFLYGIGGSTEIAVIRQAISVASTNTANPEVLSLAPVALVLIFAGLGFKIAAAPFHFYAPDVYQGATNLNAGLLAVAPKIAGIVALARLTTVMLPAVGDFAWQLVLTLALLTMTVGNVCALWQRNVRRLMAYSSIAHAGYMLIGLAALLAWKHADGGYGGISAMMLYVIVYTLASLGMFAALVYLGDQRRQINDLDELAGLGRTHPVVAASIAVFMFSLAGIPPLAGFWGKLTLFRVAIDLASSDQGNISFWFMVLAIVGAVNAAIAAAYYLRVVAVIYFRPEPTFASAQGSPASGGVGPWMAMVLCVVLVAALGVMPGRIVRFSGLVELTSDSQPEVVENLQASASPTETDPGGK